MKLALTHLIYEEPGAGSPPYWQQELPFVQSNVQHDPVRRDRNSASDRDGGPGWDVSPAIR